MERRIVFTGKQRVDLESFDLPPLQEGDVQVRVTHSLMSTGTEGIIFNRWFDPGTHWDNWIKYPFYPGYSAVGVVEAIGPGVSSPTVGQRVAMRGGHGSAHVVRAAQCFSVPSAITDEDAAWFALAKIAAMGARAAGHGLGSHVLVIGAGPVGQMAVRWAFASGSETIIVVDTVPLRLALARKGGATAIIDRPALEALPLIREANGGKGPEIVIDSTGNAAVFTAALAAADRFGRIVVLGDTGMPAQQHLSPDLITKGLQVVGAHDVLETPEWSSPRIVRLFFVQVADGRFPLDGLVTHRFRPEQATAAYDLATNHRPETMGILFTWG